MAGRPAVVGGSRSSGGCRHRGDQYSPVASGATDLLKNGRSANPMLPLTAIIDSQETVASPAQMRRGVTFRSPLE